MSSSTASISKKLPMFPEHISYSGRKLWRECQHRWFLEYICKLRQDEDGIYLDFGRAMHRTLELARPKKGRKPITYWRKHFTKVFTLLYAKHKHNYKEREQDILNPDKSEDKTVKTFLFEEFIAAGIRILEDFLSDPLLGYEGAEVLSNELELFEVVGRTDDTDIKFRGYIDLVIMAKDGRGNPVMYVCDYKTCSWGWGKDKRTDVELHDQILLYKYFLCKKFNIKQNQVRCAFILMKRQPSAKATTSVEFFPISAGPTTLQRSVDRFSRDISEIAVKFKSGNYTKNRDACVVRFGKEDSETSFVKVCPFYETEHCTNDDLGLKVIVAGSRRINDYELVAKAIENSGFPVAEVVSGKAKGVDTLGERWARFHGKPIKDFPADWDRLGKKAGHVRNQEMADYAEALVAIPDDDSIGTLDMIKRARKAGLKVYVHGEDDV